MAVEMEEARTQHVTRRARYPTEHGKTDLRSNAVCSKSIDGTR